MLIHSSKIAILPDVWSDSLEYATLLEKLQALSLHRAELQRKIKLYRRLQSMTAPFRNPQTSIQPNLVSRDSPLIKEMEKTRSLNIQVASGLVKRNRELGNDDATNKRRWALAVFGFHANFFFVKMEITYNDKTLYGGKVWYSEAYVHGLCVLSVRAKKTCCASHGLWREILIESFSSGGRIAQQSVT